MTEGLMLLILAGCADKAAEPVTEADADTDADTDTDTDTDADTDADTDTDADADTTPNTYLPSDENIRLIGRWETSDPDAPWVGWQGASILINFEGTGVHASLDPGSTTEYFRAIIDGDPTATVHLALTPGTETVEVVSGLEPGLHRLELVKETYLWDNVVFTGLTIDGTLKAPPEPAARRLVFYGDSNLAGYSLHHEENNSASRYIGSHFGLAGITARMFDAEYHNISVSGETISGLQTLADRTDWWSESPQWDFEAFPADAVIVNLGANDVGKPESTIRADYVRLLDELRVHHPDAHIVLFNGWGWDYDEPANYTDEVAAGYGDDKLSVATFPWLFEQWHGCEYDQSGMAVVLADHLSDVLGWTPSEPDVMSGYGQDGDVANGSFEQVAPFGGYGWRYFEAEGVSRVEDAESAQDGTFYVHLEDGADIHQPNPASGGQAVTATVWLRGDEGGEAATLTVDFRDQEMWTQPLQVTTEVVSLTADWAAYTVTAQAPTDSPRPVFHTRLTVAAGAGSGVSVDSIEMRTE